MSPELADRTLALLQSSLAFARRQLQQAEAERPAGLRAAPWPGAMAKARRLAGEIDRLERLAKLVEQWPGPR